MFRGLKLSLKQPHVDKKWATLKFHLFDRFLNFGGEQAKPILFQLLSNFQIIKFSNFRSNKKEIMMRSRDQSAIMVNICLLLVTTTTVTKGLASLGNGSVKKVQKPPTPIRRMSVVSYFLDIYWTLMAIIRG